MGEVTGEELPPLMWPPCCSRWPLGVWRPFDGPQVESQDCDIAAWLLLRRLLRAWFACCCQLSTTPPAPTLRPSVLPHVNDGPAPTPVHWSCPCRDSFCSYSMHSPLGCDIQVTPRAVLVLQADANKSKSKHCELPLLPPERDFCSRSGHHVSKEAHL